MTREGGGGGGGGEGRVYEHDNYLSLSHYNNHQRLVLEFDERCSWSEKGGREGGRCLD